MKMIRAGQLRHKITIQKRGSDQNGFGEELQSWVDDTAMWADIMPLRGQEYNFARQAHSEITHRIMTRWTLLSDGTRPTADNCRISYYDYKSEVFRYFDVQFVSPLYERKYMLNWMCIEEQ